MENFADKVKSFKDIKKEMKALFSINGYSEALGTNSMFKKVFWFIAFIALFTSCMVVVYQNVRGFQANDVVTQFKVMDYESMTFPAVTFCLTDFDLDDLNLTIQAKNLSSKLVECIFESKLCNESSHFSPIQLGFLNQNLDCYTFNSGKNDLLSARGIGLLSGLNIALNLSRTEKFVFKVHDNNERPSFFELEHIFEQENGKIFRVGMKKNIERKEPFPYSNCTQNINSDTSYLVNEIIQQNITYRQRYCYDRCFWEKSKENYLSKNLTEQDLIDFDYKGNCSKLCPLECSSTTFDIIQNEMNLNPNDPNVLDIHFYYSDRKYTEITQSVKVTGADFISNTGGLLGLFLELSFFSAYRFILFIFDLIFV